MQRQSMVFGVALFLLCCLFSGSAAAAPKELIIGVNTPLSGPATSQGITTQRTFDHVVEAINAKGFAVQGEQYILKPAYFDSKYVPAEAVANLEKMVSQGIRYMFSTGSGVSVPLVEKTTQAKMLQMTSGSGSDHLTSPKYPYSFRTVPCNENAFAQYVWMAKEYPQIKNVAHLNPSDEAGFTESATRLKCAKNVGYRNVANEFFKRGATDYYP